jgi:hypothetical protein
MFRVSKRVRASIVALSLGLLLTSTSFVTAANAATIKNGVACKKDGLKGKAGSKKYVVLRLMIFMLRLRISMKYLRIFYPPPLRA